MRPDHRGERSVGAKRNEHDLHAKQKSDLRNQQRQIEEP
jgi:hypothetical protein